MENKVSIEIGTMMYSRYQDLPNTVSHAIAEFVDNAIQSYLNNKSLLNPEDAEEQLRVDVDIDWANTEDKATKITIEDNAGGISYEVFSKAFITANLPEDSTGLNEFGMGMKTAAGWLGCKWSLETSALGEDTRRYFEFDLDVVQSTKAKELPYQTYPEKKDAHYTRVIIERPTKNSPTSRSLNKIKTELASIYRQFLRSKELRLRVNDELLSFEEYPILEASPYDKPDAPRLLWKKEINFSWRQYSAKGFIGVLSEMNSAMRGIVLLRRNRVIVGDEVDGRYFPKELCGQSGSPRYKRIFGELELEGFDVSFNKNDIQDKENLEALIRIVKAEISKPEFNLYAQAQEYRLDASRKSVKKIINNHNNSTRKSGEKPTSLNTREFELDFTNSTEEPVVVTEEIANPTNSYEEKYSINGSPITLRVRFLENSTTPDLFYVDVSDENNGIITCCINQNHDFFNHFKMSDEAVVILKTLAIAKYTSHMRSDDTAQGLLSAFNDFIQKIKTV